MAFFARARDKIRGTAPKTSNLESEIRADRDRKERIDAAFKDKPTPAGPSGRSRLKDALMTAAVNSQGPRGPPLTRHRKSVSISNKSIRQSKKRQRTKKPKRKRRRKAPADDGGAFEGFSLFE